MQTLNDLAKLYAMRISLILTLTALLGFIFLSVCQDALAFENDIGQSKIHPAHPLYFLKTIRENLEMRLAATHRVKLIRQMEFATRRLREVKSLAGSSHEDLIEATLERYWSHVRELPEKGLIDLELAQSIKEVLPIHLATLEKMYNQASNLRAKMSIRSALNRLIQRADFPNEAKLPVCNLFAREASSSALNEAERAVLKDRSQLCFRNFDTL